MASDNKINLLFIIEPPNIQDMCSKYIYFQSLPKKRCSPISFLNFSPNFFLYLICMLCQLKYLYLWLGYTTLYFCFSFTFCELFQTPNILFILIFSKKDQKKITLFYLRLDAMATLSLNHLL